MTLDELERRCTQLGSTERIHKESSSQDEVIEKLGQLMRELEELLVRTESEPRDAQYRKKVDLVQDALDKVSDERAYELAQRRR